MFVVATKVALVQSLNLLHGLLVWLSFVDIVNGKKKMQRKLMFLKSYRRPWYRFSLTDIFTSGKGYTGVLDYLILWSLFIGMIHTFSFSFRRAAQLNHFNYWFPKFFFVRHSNYCPSACPSIQRVPSATFISSSATSMASLEYNWEYIVLLFLYLWTNPWNWNFLIAYSQPKGMNHSIIGGCETKYSFTVTIFFLVWRLYISSI